MLIWLPVICSSIFLSQKKRYSLGFGGVSYPENNFWSQKLPGMHYCDENFSATTEYSYMERKIIPEFTKDVMPRYSSIIICSQVFQDRHIQQWKDLSKKDSFIKFYLGEKHRKVGFSNIDQENVYAYTEYEISIENLSKTAINSFVVTPRKTEKLEAGKRYEFRISVYINNNRPGVYPIGYSFILEDIASIVLIGVTLFRVIKFIIYEHNTEVPLSEIWRIPRAFRNSLTYSTVGLELVFGFLHLMILKRPQDPNSVYLTKVIIAGTVVPFFLRAFIGNHLAFITDEYDFVSCLLFYYMLFVLPIEIFDLFFNLFGSFRGFRLIYLLIADPLFLLLCLFIGRGVGSMATLIEFKFMHIETNTNESAFAHRSVPKTIKFYNIIYVVVCSLILTPFMIHILDIFYHDELLNTTLVFHTFALYASISCFYSIKRTIVKTNMLTESWFEGHLMIHFWTALVFCSLMVYNAIFSSEYHIRQFQPLAFLIVLIFAMLPCVFCIGCAFSIYSSLGMMIFAFRQPKSS